MKQQDVLSPPLFNISLEKTVRGMLIESTRVSIDNQIIYFGENLNVLGDSRSDTERAGKTLKLTAERMGLKIIVEKNNIMEKLNT